MDNDRILIAVASDPGDDARERRARMSVRRRRCNIIGIIIGALVIAPLGIMLFDRREPIVLVNGSIEPDPAIEGQEVRVTWTVTERRACDGEFARRVVDSAGKIHEFQREPTAYHRAGAPKGTNTFTRTFTLPEGMVPGMASYSTTGTRWCNVLQKYLYPIPFKGPEITFMVLPSVPKMNHRMQLLMRRN